MNGLKDKYRIYLQVVLPSITFGNGGYIAFAALYKELTDLGHKVYFFDPSCDIETPTKLIKVRPESKYLNYRNISIVGLPFVCNSSAPKAIVSLWMTGNLSRAIKEHHWEDAFVFWDTGQLLRDGYKGEKRAVKSLLKTSGLPLLTCNRYLKPLYKKYLNIDQVSYLDFFVRDDLFYYDKTAKISGTVGYQPESTAKMYPKATSRNRILMKTASQIRRSLKNNTEEDKLIICKGNHKSVARKMKQCDIFFWHNTSNTNLALFLGESFGFSMAEALLCGCVVIAKRNYFTQLILPEELLCSNVEEGIQILKHLLAHPDDKERLRIRCLEIGKNYVFKGFNEDRIRTINQTILTRGQ